tara:strand:+ start:6307 stop:6825 length:519 start_codon:yes stop_codon:yes gene_type:complete
VGVFPHRSNYEGICKMNMKFSVGIVIAIVLQVSGFVWWIAQQSQTIETLKSEVEELTARTEVEKEVTLINDVEQLKKDIKELSDKTLAALLDIDSDFKAMQSFVNSQDKLINDTFTKQMIEENDRIASSFVVVEEWIDELDVDVDSVYSYIDDELQKLDKKLSDRIKDHRHD